MHLEKATMHCRIYAACSLLSLATLAAAGSVPNPNVIGPIPANAQPGDPSHDYPFFSTAVDLASHGYIEEEFFFEGASQSLRHAGAGHRCHHR
jgi:hypothetical protein